MASTKRAAELNAHTPRTDEALERIADQLENGYGQVETGVDVSIDREIEERRADVKAGLR